MLNNVAVQWLIRRVPDWGGWVGTFLTTLFGIYAVLPPRAQEAVQMAFSGNWEQITLGSLVPLAAVIYAQVISYRSTVKPQAIVAENGKLVTNPLAPKKEKEVADVVTNVSSKKSLWDILKGQ